MDGLLIFRKLQYNHDMVAGEMSRKSSLAVVIPAYKVADSIVSVVKSIGSEVDFIIVVDDACPQASGQKVLESNRDSRVVVVSHTSNQGVGGAVLSGYEKALEFGAEIIIKIDGDGQMDTKKILDLIFPIIQGNADYTKGNRFFNVEKIVLMPKLRIFGNAGLSFLSKLSTGYWSIFDPNNGYTAIKSEVLQSLPVHKIEKRFFFESDMLFRLNLIGAVVVDIPMDPIYKDEKSNLSPVRSFFEFAFKHNRNFLKRIFYTHILREFSLATLNLLFGTILILFGVLYGFRSWVGSAISGNPTNVSALILISMSVLSGLQMILSFISYDISREPKRLVFFRGIG